MPFAPPRLNRLVDGLDPDGPAEACFARAPPAAAITGRIGLMPGSFNPVTDAHVALARAGREAGLSVVLYLLSKRTVDKERITGIPLADRLELLARIASPTGDAVAFVNRGLYVDQAATMRAALPEAAEFVFLVGHDKIVQIFDARYYDDRDATLDRLFAAATFLVAPRGAESHDDLSALLAIPENRAFAARVQPLPLGEEHRAASSTRVRRGEADDVPPAVRAYLDEYHPFARR